MYREAQAGGSAEQLRDAQVQLSYALAHSGRQENVGTAQRLAGELLAGAGAGEGEGDEGRHLLYICAVADYRLGHYSAAREKLRRLVLLPGGHRQAQRLLDEVEDRIVKEGLLGAGLVGAGVLGVGLVLGALFGGGRGSRG